MSRELAFRLTSKDFEMQTFRVGGSGGQNRDKNETGVRFLHPSSGAVGECREYRRQIDNKRNAFRRMAESPEFQRWAADRALSVPPVSEVVRSMMDAANLKIEHREGGKWVEE